jgi:RNA-directed DNA polymerase
VTRKDYETNQEAKLADLHQRLHRAGYRALPSKRKYIPKADGRLRPLGIAAREDAYLISPPSAHGVQRAVVEVLNVIYEQDFLGFSPTSVFPPTAREFRPKRSQHDALDALAVSIDKRNVAS